MLTLHETLTKSNMINISSHKSHYLVDNIFTLDNRDIWATRICTKRTNTNKTYVQDDKNTYEQVCREIYMYRNREMTFIYLLFIRVRLG